MKRMSRRTFLATLGAAAGAAGIAYWQRHALLGGPAPREFVNPLRVPGQEGVLGILPLTSPLVLDARQIEHELLPGMASPLLVYAATRKGGHYINPTFTARSGSVVDLTLHNSLADHTIIHWHGFHVDEKNDGGPLLHVVGARGGTYRYQFPIVNRAGTYWYHPHPHHAAGAQVHAGLAGLFIVEDDDELTLRERLDLQLGVTDLPLIIQDKRIDRRGRLVYTPTDEDWQSGYFGNEVLVNLTPAPYLEAATRIYRLRLLNGSNARLFRLAFLSGERAIEFQVIGTDGGLLERPYRVREAFVSPSERVDLLLDLTQARPGQVIMLTSLAFDPMHHESPGRAHPHAAHAAHAAAGAIPDGAEIPLLRIEVTRQEAAQPSALPAPLSRLVRIDAARAGRRPFILDFANAQWRINGLTYDLEVVPITVQRATTEVWEIRNVEQSMPHPMHVHGFPFQVLERRGSPAQQRVLAVTEQGLAATDLGWKDSILVWPGETVRIALDFTHDFEGEQIYMFHCHNLEHEDRGMMINFRVT